MEENKEKKTITLSLSTGVSLIIIIMLSVVILAMAYFYNIKDIKGKNQNQPENNQVANVTPAQNIAPTQEITPTVPTTKFTNEQVKESIQKYLEMCGSTYGSPSYLVEKFGWKMSGENGYETINEVSYIKTKIEYNEFIEKVLEYISENVYKNNLNKTLGVECFKNVNGLLYVANVGSSGIGYEVESVDSKENDTYIAKYYGVIHTEENEEGKKRGDVQQTIEFTVAEHNGKCIINSIISE